MVFISWATSSISHGITPVPVSTSEKQKNKGIFIGQNRRRYIVKCELEMCEIDDSQLFVDTFLKIGM